MAKLPCWARLCSIVLLLGLIIGSLAVALPWKSSLPKGVGDDLRMFSASQIENIAYPWWDNSWQYRKQITLTTHPENYQIKIFLDNVDNLGGHLASTRWADIRFTENDNGPLLSYYIENYQIGTSGHDNATIWVRRPDNDVDERDNTIYVYYGNSSATDGENVLKVFEVPADIGFDSTTGWTRGGTGTVAINTLQSRENYSLPKKSGWSVADRGSGIGDFAVDYTINSTSTQSGAGCGVGWSDNAGTYFSKENNGVIAIFYTDSDNVQYAELKTRLNGTTYDNHIGFTYNGTTYYCRLTRLGNVFTFRGWTNSGRTGTALFTRTLTTALPTLRYGYSVQSYNDGVTQSGWIDTTLFRKYASTEPTATLGVEETYNSFPTIPFPGQPVLLSPSNGASITANTSITFTWTRGLNADNHRIEISTTSNFTSIVDNQTISAPNDSTWTKTAGYPTGTYYWRTVAHNSTGETISSVWSFTVTSPTNVTSQGTLIENFEDISQWSVDSGGDLGTQTADTVNFKEGTQGLRLNSVNGDTVWSTKTTSLNLSTANNFVFWLYVYDASRLDYINIYFSSVTNMSKFFAKQISGTNFNTGWNKVLVSTNEFTTTGGESWSNTMIRLRFRVKAITGQNVSATYDDFRENYVAKPVVILTFDDACENVFAVAKPIMDANGQKGVAFVITNKIGDTDRLSLSQLQTMYAAGWDISSHTLSHPHLTTLDPTQLDNEINGSYSWLVNNGFGRSAIFFSYPYGDYNDNVIAKVKENYKMARCSNLGYNLYLPFDNSTEYLIKTVNVDNAMSVATVEGWINNANGLLVLLFHNIADSSVGNSTDYSTANFQTISNYLKTKQDAGNLQVITFSDYYYSSLATIPFPGQPVLLSPGDGASITANTAITFTWTRGLNADNHRIEISTTSNFTSTVDNQTISAPDDNTWAKTAGYPTGTYYWRTVAHNSSGETISSVWSFTVTTNVTNQGTLIENFEDISQWSVDSGGDLGTQAADTVNFKEGTQGLRLNSVNGDTVWSTKTTSLNLSTANNFAFWLYVYDASKLDYINIYFSSVTNMSKFFAKQISGTNFNTGWNKVLVSTNEFTTTGGESWSNTMIRLRFRVKAITGQNVSATYDDFRENYNTTA